MPLLQDPTSNLFQSFAVVFRFYPAEIRKRLTVIAFVNHLRERGAIREEMRDPAIVRIGEEEVTIDSAKANINLIGQLCRSNTKTAAKSRLSQPLPTSRPLDAASPSRPEDRDRAVLVNPHLNIYSGERSDLQCYGFVMQ